MNIIVQCTPIRDGHDILRVQVEMPEYCKTLEVKTAPDTKAYLAVDKAAYALVKAVEKWVLATFKAT